MEVEVINRGRGRGKVRMRSVMTWVTKYDNVSWGWTTQYHKGSARYHKGLGLWNELEAILWPHEWRFQSEAILNFKITKSHNTTCSSFRFVNTPCARQELKGCIHSAEKVLEQPLRYDIDRWLWFTRTRIRKNATFAWMAVKITEQLNT